LKPKSIILIGVVAVILAAIIYTFMGSQDQSAYGDQIKKDRDERDTFMKSSPESPFAKDPASYEGL
jgi:hypothetical protein